MPNKDTLEYYNRSAVEYQRRMATSEFPYVCEFAEQFQKGMRILDLGCGPGHHSAFMADFGLQVDATDASDEMIALAAAHEGVNAWVSRFGELTDKAVYDGIWANFSLLHAERSEMASILENLRRAVKAGALLHIGLKTGSGTRVDALGRFYTYYTPEELSDFLTDAGFTPFRTGLGSGVGMAGKDEPWVVIWAKAS